MQAIHFPYYVNVNKEDNENIISSYIKQYSNCLHFMYNRVKDNIRETDIKHLPINNIDLLDSWFKQSCVKEALQISNSSPNEKVIFGGKRNFLDLINKKITKEQFLEKRLNPLYSIGEASNPCVKGNRKFHIEQDLKNIVFKPNKNTKISLEIPSLSKSYLNILKQLYILQEEKKISLTYKLTKKEITIFYDEKELASKSIRNIKNNRVMAIDLNPNYIGWSITDWVSENEFKIIKSGVYSLKYLNDKEKKLKEEKLNSSDSKRIYINNKRNFETLEISKDLIKKTLHFNVEMFAIEDLNIKSNDKEKGKQFNKLCNNQWVRNKLVNNLEKRCNLFNIRIQKIKANYSSFIGNVLYRNLKLPDMVLSSIEIGRRGYEYVNQYIKKTKTIKKNIIFPSEKFYKPLIIKSLEEFNIKEKFSNLVDLYNFLKKSKIKYRLSLDDLHLEFSRQKHLKYQTILV